MEVDYQDLLQRAKWGEVSEEEINDVARELQSPMPKDDPYRLLLILGKSGAVQYRPLVATYLDKAHYTGRMPRLALQILCHFWGMTADYLDEVEKFLQGVDSEASDDYRLMAISIAGEYLRTNHHARLLDLLLKTFEDEKEPNLIVREAAYLALARAMGREYRDMPSAAEHFDLRTGTDPNVIQEAKSRLSKERRAA